MADSKPDLILDFLMERVDQLPPGATELVVSLAEWKTVYAYYVATGIYPAPVVRDIQSGSWELASSVLWYAPHR